MSPSIVVTATIKKNYPRIQVYAWYTSPISRRNHSTHSPTPSSQSLILHVFYKKTEDDLSSKMQWSLDHETELTAYKGRAVKRIAGHYTWDKVTDGYEELFRELVVGKYLRQF